MIFTRTYTFLFALAMLLLTAITAYASEGLEDIVFREARISDGALFDGRYSPNPAIIGQQLSFDGSDFGASPVTHGLSLSYGNRSGVLGTLSASDIIRWRDDQITVKFPAHIISEGHYELHISSNEGATNNSSVPFNVKLPRPNISSYLVRNPCPGSIVYIMGSQFTTITKAFGVLLETREPTAGSVYRGITMGSSVVSWTDNRIGIRLKRDNIYIKGGYYFRFTLMHGGEGFGGRTNWTTVAVGPASRFCVSHATERRESVPAYNVTEYNVAADREKPKIISINSSSPRSFDHICLNTLGAVAEIPLELLDDIGIQEVKISANSSALRISPAKISGGRLGESVTASGKRRYTTKFTLSSANRTTLNNERLSIAIKDFSGQRRVYDFTVNISGLTNRARVKLNPLPSNITVGKKIYFAGHLEPFACNMKRNRHDVQWQIYKLSSRSDTRGNSIKRGTFRVNGGSGKTPFLIPFQSSSNGYYQLRMVEITNNITLYKSPVIRVNNKLPQLEEKKARQIQIQSGQQQNSRRLHNPNLQIR